MTWGKELKSLLEMQRLGMNPKALIDRPTLHPAFYIYIEAYYACMDSRDYAMDGTPFAIPMSEFESYCRIAWRGHEDFWEKLVMIMKRLDRVYLDIAAKNAESVKSK